MTLTNTFDQYQGTPGGICIDMSGMNKILDIHGMLCITSYSPEDLTVLIEADADVVLQPGVKWEDLNQALADKKIPLFFPVSLCLSLDFGLLTLHSSIPVQGLQLVE